MVDSHWEYMGLLKNTLKRLYIYFYVNEHDQQTMHIEVFFGRKEPRLTTTTSAAATTTIVTPVLVARGTGKRKSNNEHNTQGWELRRPTFLQRFRILVFLFENAGHAL